MRSAAAVLNERIIANSLIDGEKPVMWARLA